MGYSSNWPGNDIGKITQYITDAMDKIFVHDLKTAGMRADPKMVENGRNAKTILLATPKTTGAGNYSVTKGWVQSKSSLEWMPYTLRYDRGASFLVDSLETSQSGGLASIGLVGGEFIRQQMVPEIDATRIATTAGIAADAGFKTESETLQKGTILSKITDALDGIYDRTGIDTGVTIYLNNKLKGVLEGSTEYQRVKSIDSVGRNLDQYVESINGNPVVFVPSHRMFSKILLHSGENDDGGFDNAGSEINFLLAAPDTAQGVISYNNVVALPKGSHTEGDGDFYAYRIYHDCICPANKTIGLYVSLKDAHDSIHISYRANGGVGSVKDDTAYTVGSEVTVKPITGIVPPTGKTFVSWNTKADGTGTSYNAGATFAAATDLTLYAQYN